MTHMILAILLLVSAGLLPAQGLPPLIDRELLFGVIALQLDILDQPQFAEACAVWALHMDRPMADLLQERGWITPDDRQEITRNLERKLRRHRGDVHASLAEAADSSVR